MAEILESAMLLCFGLSWPISVVKNLKAKTAKSTSLPFILLIITGYVAGIGAKFISHRINYVLAVYIFNIIMVTANLIVYFINKGYDRRAEAASRSNMATSSNTKIPSNSTAKEYTEAQSNTVATQYTEAQSETVATQYTEAQSNTVATQYTEAQSNTVAAQYTEAQSETVAAQYTKTQSDMVAHTNVNLSTETDANADHSTQQSGRSIMDKYRELNTITEDGGILLFGSDYFSSMPLGELAHSFHVDVPVYNRSIKDISIDRVQSYMDVCVFDLHPQKIFVNLGESDMKDPDFDVESFISKYEWLLYTMHAKMEAEIYIVSVISRHPAAARVNARLKSLAAQSGCKYIDAVSALSSDRPMLRVFEQLIFYFRNRPISFADAMDMVTIGNTSAPKMEEKAPAARKTPHKTHQPVSYAK